ncbi:MAG: RNB domain-containing ribonuclease [Thermoleophilia bacterium]|nr:RNB domain-containing ribonuclease [Thermoleophilia bacterium]
MARVPKNRTAPGATYVAVLSKRGKTYEAESAFGDEENALVGRKSLGAARPGDLVMLRTDGRGRGEVVRRLGKADSLHVIMEGILAHFRVPRGFSEAAVRDAEAAALLAAREDPRRDDLTGLLSFTIDPDEARDFDDAISLEEGPGEGEITLYVHVSDVSYYVADGSALDDGARKKACSVYLPVMVEHMLPAVLSNDVCSLKPGLERKCVTAEMIFRWPQAAEPDEPGGGREAELLPVRERFYRSTIRSRRRLTYNEVDDMFEGIGGLAARGSEDEKMEEALSRCRALASDLRNARHARGALAIHTHEPEFRIEHGEIIGVRPRPESESHALIEEFMIAANEAVARFLERRQSDCIYRVHEEPDAQAVDSLFDLLEDLGVATPPFSLDAGSPRKAGEAVRELLRKLPTLLTEQQRSRSVFGEIVLRSLKQAMYLEDNLGHFGLSSPAYLHFTSPIRRYPDVVVHRALMRELGLEEQACSRLELSEVARVSSDNERRAALAERTGEDVALAFLLEKMLFEEGWDRTFEGEIVSVIPSGLFIRFEHSFEGYLPARKLWGDYFTISEKGSALVGRRRGRPYRLGDRITVRVANIDRLRGKVELEPAK